MSKEKQNYMDILEKQMQKPCEDVPDINDGDIISRQEAIRIAEQGQVQGYEWQFKELVKLPSVNSQPKTGHWIRMSDLSEQEDDRYKCSHCGNVIHHKNKMDLYTFNSWCGRCGSDNGRKIEVDI